MTKSLNCLYLILQESNLALPKGEEKKGVKTNRQCTRRKIGKIGIAENVP